MAFTDDPPSDLDTGAHTPPVDDLGGHSPDGSDAQPGAVTREALLGQLPTSVRALLSPDAPVEQLQAAVQEFAKSGMLRSDYDRKRQLEGGELTRLRAELDRSVAAQSAYEKLLSGTPPGGAPATPRMTEDEISTRMLETTDPREHRQLLEQLVDTRARGLVDQALADHPVLRQAQLAMAADRGRPADMPVDVYRVGYQTLLADLQARGIDPNKVEPGVVQFLTPYWAELTRLRGAGPSATRPATNTPAPGVRAPTATPSSSGPTPSTRVGPDALKTFGPSSSLADRVKATLAQMGMSPGDLARLRSQEA